MRVEKQGRTLAGQLHPYEVFNVSGPQFMSGSC